jgi:uncharacterized protein YbaR (Trm112 family)
MKKSLLKMLVCPDCLPEEIQLEAKIIREQPGDILDGASSCSQCGGVYSIEDGTAFLDFSARREGTPVSKYETGPVLSSYLWSHYGDIMGDEEASSAYREWAGLMNGGFGMALDLGAAVGRFAFEMTSKSDYVISIENSVSFEGRANRF